MPRQGLMLSPGVLEVFPFSSVVAEEAKKFRKLVTEAQSILISSTLTSDGDSIGAQLGVLSLISHIKGSVEGVKIVDQSPVPERYQFLKGSEQILSLEEWDKRGLKINFDLGITCDGGIERTGDVQRLFTGISKNILVDHHSIGSERQYASRLLDLDVSSTCELVYLLHEYFGFPVKADLAEALYVGIVFDTGFFKHSLTKPRTHHVAAQLISTGIDFSKISDRAILERTWEAQLLLKALLDNMEVFDSGRVIVSHWTTEDYERIQPKDGDQEGMINQLYYTDKAEVVVLMTEKSKTQTKVSFRSKGKVNVAELARKLHPQGGGHVRASGCELDLSLSQAQSQILSELKQVLK